jgi:hypothetical protein
MTHSLKGASREAERWGMCLLASRIGSYAVGGL